MISHYPDEVPWQAEEERDGSTEVLAKAVNFLESVTIQVYPYQVCIQTSSPKVFNFSFRYKRTQMNIHGHISRNGHKLKLKFHGNFHPALTLQHSFSLNICF